MPISEKEKSTMSDFQKWEIAAGDIFDQLPLCIIDSKFDLGSLPWNAILESDHQHIHCKSVASFLSRFSQRQEFSLLLVVVNEMAEWELISTMCEAVRAPVILLVRPEDWPCMPASIGSFFSVDIVSISSLSKSELLWRVDSAIGKTSSLEHEIIESNGFTWGDYRFVEGERSIVFLHGKAILLQRRQYIFALVLFKNIGKIVSRNWFMNFFRDGSEGKKTSRTLAVCAVNLRKKLGLNSENGLVLRAVYGRGYQLLSVNPKE